MKPAILVAFGLSFATAIVLGQGQGNTVTAQIVIGPGSDGACVVTTSPADIHSAKRNYKIRWDVTNNCDGTRTVTVGNFKHENDENRRKDPIRIDKVDNVASNGTGVIEGRIKGIKDEDLGTYKYDVLIDGVVAVDPKIDIDG
jgi:hypothetical protein